MVTHDAVFLWADTPRTLAYMAAFARRKVHFAKTIPIPPGEAVNAPAIIAALRAAAPRFVVYSGYGGQMVGPECLAVAPFLHAHSGWLPAQRGSTTLYYSLIEQGDCAVSVIQLTAGLDEGPIYAQRRYPAIDSDLDAYDAEIRADLLADVLRAPTLPEPLAQVGPGTVYFVAHPVLRHIARLRASRAAP